MTKLVLPVLINAEGGTAQHLGAALHDRVKTAFAVFGVAAEVRMLAAAEVRSTIEQAANSHPRIVVAGGDGTLSCAAQSLAGTSTELAILPLGTLNHFARDLAIPHDLDEAVRMAVQGHATPVDVGEINGHRFINNVSIGLYPFMVRSRDDIRARRGWPKWLATVPASWGALSRLRHHRLRLDMGRGDKAIITPLLFVGNNRYSLEHGSLGTRASLSDGALSVYAVSRSGRLHLMWFGMRALVGLTNRDKDFEILGETRQLIVRSAEKTIEIGIDGEVERLQLPLELKALSGALRVVVSAEAVPPA